MTGRSDDHTAVGSERGRNDEELAIGDERPRGQASSVALIRAASAGPIPGTAAICSTGASRTRLIEPKTLSSSRLPLRADAGQVVERGPDGRACPQVAVVGDREAMRLVAQPLDEVERR